MSKLANKRTMGKSGAMTKRGEGQMTFSEQTQRFFEIQKRGFDTTVREAAVAEAAGLIDKENLVDVPFLILGVRQHPDGQFCTAQILLRDNTLTAFHASLSDTNQRGEPKRSLGHEILELPGQEVDGMFNPPVLIRSGLRMSTYDDPKYGSVSSFYLNCSPSKAEMATRAQATKIVGIANGRQARA